LAILKAGFNPLTKEDTSIRRPLITEYLGMKYMCESYLTGTNLLDFFTMVEVGKEKPSPSFLKKMVSRIAFAFFFNRNRTVRECKEYYDQLITGASKCPPDISEPMTDWKMKMKRLRLGNPIGQMLVYIAIPYFSRTVETSSKLKVLSDLLAITLARRSGQELNLPDFYTGKAYIIDEKTGVAMSVGPDGLPGTEDDIKLGDWPWSPSRGSGR
jgi:hypothetical protein